MVEFNYQYYSPMDKQYYESFNEIKPSAPKLEEPIIPLSSLGQTVPETDPSGRFKNVVQGAQAAFRAGAGNIQIMIMTPREAGMGGAPKALGKEVREALKEIALANETMITGVELPTASNNLSGLDYQRNTIDEDKRKRELEEVKDAIKFTADAAMGGGVDIVSWEFPRPIFEAPGNKDAKFQVPGEKEKADIKFVDTRTGALANFNRSFLPHPTEQGNIGTWEDWKRTFPENTEEELKKHLFDNQIAIAKGEIARMEEIYMEPPKRRMAELDKALSQNKITQQQYDEKKKPFQERIDQMSAYISAQQRQIAELEQRKRVLKPFEQYAKENTTQSYAEAGITAMQETKTNPNIKRDVYVGPEIGWPQFYGSHPEEFIAIIKGARKRMAELLTNPTVERHGQEVKNPYYDPNINQKEAEERAKKHIKGMLDTGHMGMWLEHFKPELPWQKRVTEFNKWYMEEIKKLAKENVLGGIQAVDSMSGTHAHLPAGQGVLPVVEAVKELRKQGFTGVIVSEGHEEEKFGEGRILMKTWQEFDPRIKGGYGGAPIPFTQIHGSYFGRQYPPRQMFGSYVPPFGEYRPWSEIPFE